jgi:hypothetical protein
VNSTIKEPSTISTILTGSFCRRGALARSPNPTLRSGTRRSPHAPRPLAHSP